jgi:RES domain-containing protein
MRAWRLCGKVFAHEALSGEGAARYGGRWNSPGVRLAYLADSLALATLELSVHLSGARVAYVAIEYDIPNRLVASLAATRLPRRWATDEAITARIGNDWAAGSSLALRVPSVLVDARSGEGNVLVNAASASIAAIREVQRFEVVLDERL